MDRFFVLIIFYLLLSFKVVANDVFGLRSNDILSGTTHISANSNISFDVKSFIPDRIVGLSVDGTIVRQTENYFVRIILKDKDENEHLVLETYKEINDNNNIEFCNYCEETSYLDGIIADSIKIYISGASLKLSKINYVDFKTSNKRNNLDTLKTNCRVNQLSEIVDKINAYNLAHNKLWKAGITALSKKTYIDKKRILGFDNDMCTGGMEYYVGGIFEVDDENGFQQRDSYSDPYVDTFDWRNQHGKNWISPNKHQGNSGFCHFFTCVACIEAVANLYYNRILNLDLSEQELACCCGIVNPYYGVSYIPSSLIRPLDYAMTHGVCDEEVYPFVDSPTQTTCRSSEINPNELVRIAGYENVNNNYEDSLKNALINHGPLISGWRYWGYNPDSTIYNKNHSMLVVGYGKLQEGDTLFYFVEPNGFGNGAFTVPPGHPCIGKTYWIYKNSYGLSQDEAHQGYMHIIHYNYSESFNYTYYCKGPISTLTYADNDVVCSDEDGDGYFFWGLGSKPSHCPSWIPDIPDGNDNDAYLGPRDEFGFCEELNPSEIPEIVIQTNDSILDSFSFNSNIRILPNASLTVGNTLNLFGHVAISIEGNGELIIDGGTLTNAVINVSPGGKLTIRNNGKVVMRTNTIFSAPIGALVYIESGGICQY